MKTALIVGGPLVAIIGFGFWSGLLDFADRIDGIEHLGGVEEGGTFLLEHQETYQCDENGNNCVLVDEDTSFSEIAGLDFEEQPIEYRTGSEPTHVRKLNGLTKFTNIVMHRPSGFDWGTLKFEFEPEMQQVAPPTLVVPAQ